MVSSPSETTPLIGTASCFNCSLAELRKAVKSPWVLLSKGRANRVSSERQSRTTQSTRVAHIWLQSSERQDPKPLLLQACLEPRLVSDAQGDQFFIALHQRGHTALGNTDPAHQEGLMHFANIAVCAKCIKPIKAITSTPNSPCGTVLLLRVEKAGESADSSARYTDAQRESTSRDQTVW